jgi:hypothetical protein
VPKLRNSIHGLEISSIRLEIIKGGSCRATFSLSTVGLKGVFYSFADSFNFEFLVSSYGKR